MTDSTGLTGGQQAGLGAAAILGGSLLDYYGQRQGAKSLDAEGRRQSEEQRAMLEARQAAYMQALGRANPAQRGAVVGQQSALRMNASAPALAAGGSALGLSGGQVAAVGRAMLPTQMAQGQQATDGVVQQRRDETMSQLRNEQGDIDAAMQGAAALYPMRNEIAKSKGAKYRTGGELIGSVGMPLLVAGMNQPSGQWPTSGGPSGYTALPTRPTTHFGPGPWAPAAPSASPMTRPYLPQGALYPAVRR